MHSVMHLKYLYNFAIIKIAEAESNIEILFEKKIQLLERTRPIVKKELKLKEFLDDIEFLHETTINHFEMNNSLKTLHNELNKVAYNLVLGLKDRMHNFPSQLSGGEQQRVALARALVNNPSMLIADEPTGNLDNETADGIMKLLTEINSEKGTAIVMVTHNRQLFLDYPGRVMVCKDETCTEQLPDEPIDLDLTI